VASSVGEKHLFRPVLPRAARRTFPAQVEPLPDGDGIFVLQAE